GQLDFGMGRISIGADDARRTLAPDALDRFQSRNRGGKNCFDVTEVLDKPGRQDGPDAFDKMQTQVLARRVGDRVACGHDAAALCLEIGGDFASTAESGIQLVPVVDAFFSQTPAQVDVASVACGGEVYKPLFTILELAADGRKLFGQLAQPLESVAVLVAQPRQRFGSAGGGGLLGLRLERSNM